MTRNAFVSGPFYKYLVASMDARTSPAQLFRASAEAEDAASGVVTPRGTVFVHDQVERHRVMELIAGRHHVIAIPSLQPAASWLTPYCNVSALDLAHLRSLDEAVDTSLRFVVFEKTKVMVYQGSDVDHVWVWKLAGRSL